MINENKIKQIHVVVEEISSYIKTFLSTQPYEDNIVYLFGLLSDAEKILVEIGNLRFESQLTESQILLEEQIFDEWMALYNLAKKIQTKRFYSDECKSEINKHAGSIFIMIKAFEEEMEFYDMETVCEGTRNENDIDQVVYESFCTSEKEYDFNKIADLLRTFLIGEGVDVEDFELDESRYYDGIKVSYIQEYPLLNAPVNYSIHYDSFYGEDTWFSACIGVPREILAITDMECRGIATELIRNPNIMVSFEGRSFDKKYVGIFHIIDSVYGKHVVDQDEMRQHMYEVRRVITDIAIKLFEWSAKLYVKGCGDSQTTVARFEQSDSMAEDDRAILQYDYFNELSYDPYDPINLEDTVDYTEILKGLGESELDRK